MVIAAVTYSTMHLADADAQYSLLLDHHAKALRSLTLARSHVNRFGKFLYEEFSVRDAGRIRDLDASLDQTATDFNAAAAEALRNNPDLTAQIQAARELFNHAVSGSSRV